MAVAQHFHNLAEQPLTHLPNRMTIVGWFTPRPEASFARAVLCHPRPVGGNHYYLLNEAGQLAQLPHCRDLNDVRTMGAHCLPKGVSMTFFAGDVLAVTGPNPVTDLRAGPPNGYQPQEKRFTYSD